MDETEPDVVAVCTRIIELAHVFDRRDADTLLEELEAVVHGLEQRDTDAVPQQVKDDIDAMQDIIDGMSDSE